MTRHVGTLPQEYVSKLERLSLPEIAAEAAKYRSDGKRCGTATALILRWAFAHRISRNDAGARAWFLALYTKAWEAEKADRAAGKSCRPDTRPARGGRNVGRRMSARMGFAHALS